MKRKKSILPNLPYWLKGGIIGAVSSLFILFLLIIWFGTHLLEFLPRSLDGMLLTLYIILSLTFPGILRGVIGITDVFIRGWQDIGIILLNVALYFLIGAFIGYRYGKTKNKIEAVIEAIILVALLAYLLLKVYPLGPFGF